MISFEDMVIKSDMKQNPPEDMVLIPEGPFLMGSTEEDIKKLLELDKNVEASRFDVEVPQREVYMSAYLIDKSPITNAEYKKFIESGGYKQRDFWSDAGWDYVQQVKPLDSDGVHSAMDSEDDCPVVNVSWYEAEAFAKICRKKTPYRGRVGKGSSWYGRKNISVGQRIR